MNTISRKLKLWFGMYLLVVSILTSVAGRTSERIYTLAEVAAIDRENAMWKLVEATEEIDSNINRLLAAGFPALEVEALKARLVELWNIEPLEQFGWLDVPTVEKIRALEQEFTIRMREARVREETGLRRGANGPETPMQVNARWRRAMIQLLDYREIQEFLLMNSASARASNRMTKGIRMTVDERRVLCEMQQDLDQIFLMKCFDRWQNSARNEAVLDQWKRIRDFLGDDRFAVYLQAADPGFSQMAAVLSPISGVSHSMILDLWWLRKSDEKAELLMIWGSERSRLKVRWHETAAAILGEKALKVYEANDDAKWLARSSPYQVGPADRFAQRAGD